MATLAVNPTYDAALRKASAASWAAARSGTTADSIISAAATTLSCQADATAGAFLLDRPVLVFDTSPIAGGTITAATLAINITGGDAPGAGPNAFVDLVEFTPANPASIATSDWQYIDTAGLNIANELNYNEGFTGTQTFTLTSPAAHVSPSSYTCFAILQANDLFDQVNAAWLNITGTYAYHEFNTTNAGSNKPLLTVTYTPATPAAPPLGRRDSALLPFYSFPD